MKRRNFIRNTALLGSGTFISGNIDLLAATKNDFKEKRYQNGRRSENY